MADRAAAPPCADGPNGPSWLSAGGSAGSSNASSRPNGRHSRSPAWLTSQTYPGNREMQVSHETIYMSLFVQPRGALRKELGPRYLRTRRLVMRRTACP